MNKSLVVDHIEDSIVAKRAMLHDEKLISKIHLVASLVYSTLISKKKILIAGNGGSAADAQHFVAELVGRYKIWRNGFPAISLSSDPSVVTAISNDFGYERVFEKQIEALGQKGDVFIGITTSGRSKNILLAANKARDMGLDVVLLTSVSSNMSNGIFASYAIEVPSTTTSIIQECHITIIHSICELFESALKDLIV